MAAQAAPRYELRRLDGAAFVETVHTDVTTLSGLAERHRLVLRTSQFGTMVRGDTLVVTADTVDLRETAERGQQLIDVDAVIGARWKLTLDAHGDATVDTEPFVPGEVGDVSDMAIAMRDFFPPIPPVLAIGKQATDTVGRVWRRLADSAGRSRYHWSAQQHRDSSYVAADSVAVQASLDTQDESDVAWDLARGPVAWSRRIETTATSRFAGKTNRAAIDQRIVVRRTQ